MITAGQDAGGGTNTALAQIAAEELGLPLAHVTLALGDSARGPFAPESGGSATNSTVGPAERSAAADARRQILELAAARYGESPEDLVLVEGSIVGPGGARRPVADIVGLLGNGQILGTGVRGPNPVGLEVMTFGVQLAEVAVDIRDGRGGSRADRPDPRRGSR